MDDLICEWCDGVFSRPSEMGPTPKFCSASHRQRAYEVHRIESLVGELTAERDRLRAVVETGDGIVRSIFDKVEAERDRLRAALADVIEHAMPIAEDDEGFVAVGYTVTVGAIHRAIAASQQPDISEDMGAGREPES